MDIIGEKPKFVVFWKILGLDVMFDENRRPWLLEINSAPSLVLSNGSESDRALKIPLIRSALKIAYAHSNGKSPSVEDSGLFQPLDFQ